MYFKHFSYSKDESVTFSIVLIFSSITCCLKLFSICICRGLAGIHSTTNLQGFDVQGSQDLQHEGLDVANLLHDLTIDP